MLLRRNYNPRTTKESRLIEPFVAPCPFFRPRSSFRPPKRPIPRGLSASGANSRPDWLLDAYRHGIFPWPTGNAGAAIPWCSPNPRAILDLDRFHVPRRLQRTCRGGRFTATLDQDFAGVIRGCATAGGRRGRTWLIPPMIRAYTELFRLGHAHSVEVWHDGKLAGGTYGVAIAGLFAAESMFHRVRDASKVALVRLVSHLRAARLHAAGHSATHAARRAVRRRRDSTPRVPAPAGPCPDRSGRVSLVRLTDRFCRSASLAKPQANSEASGKNLTEGDSPSERLPRLSPFRPHSFPFRLIIRSLRLRLTFRLPPSAFRLSPPPSAGPLANRGCLR